jgi:hypothetical protein
MRVLGKFGPQRGATQPCVARGCAHLGRGGDTQVPGARKFGDTWVVCGESKGWGLYKKRRSRGCKTDNKLLDSEGEACKTWLRTDHTKHTVFKRPKLRRPPSSLQLRARVRKELNTPGTKWARGRGSHPICEKSTRPRKYRTLRGSEQSPDLESASESYPTPTTALQLTHTTLPYSTPPQPLV